MANTMWAAVVEAMRTEPVMRRVPVPEPGDGQVLVRISVGGLNPTDLVASTGVRGELPVPYIPGTEGVKTLPDGTRVYAAPTRLPQAGARCRLQQHLTTPNQIDRSTNRITRQPILHNRGQ